MKTITSLFLLLFLFLVSLSYGQVTNTRSFTFGGQTRQYLEYIPAIYDGSEAVPLVICLHGLGDNMTNFSGIGMHQVADTANVIVITPQAMNSILGTAWNSGASYSGITLNGNVNDQGFLNALIDTTMARFNIDITRVYFAGFSMGSFMCHRMACAYGHRIAAIASVAGTIGTSYNCVPALPVPVCHLHGTADQTIAYTGCMYGMDAQEVIDFWVNYNQCTPTPLVENLPDLVVDSFTVDKITYEHWDNEVIHFRVNGADHTWLFENYNDIDYTQEIWKFFLRHQRILSEVEQTDVNENRPGLWYDPAQGMLVLDLTRTDNAFLEIMDASGRLVFSRTDCNSTIDLDLGKGLYFANLIQNGQRRSLKFVVD